MTEEIGLKMFWSLWFGHLVRPKVEAMQCYDFMICEFAVFTVRADLNIYCKVWSYFKFLNGNDGFFY